MFHNLCQKLNCIDCFDKNKAQADESDCPPQIVSIVEGEKSKDDRQLTSSEGLDYGKTNETEPSGATDELKSDPRSIKDAECGSQRRNLWVVAQGRLNEEEKK